MEGTHSFVPGDQVMLIHYDKLIHEDAHTSTNLVLDDTLKKNVNQFFKFFLR